MNKFQREVRRRTNKAKWLVGLRNLTNRELVAMVRKKLKWDIKQQESINNVRL
jgi:hypothetical protein